MKKNLKILAIVLTTFMSVTYAKADTIINIKYGEDNAKSELWYLNNLNWTSWSDYEDTEKSGDCNSKEDCYNKALEYFNSSNYQYYSMFVEILPQNNQIILNIINFNILKNEYIYQHVFSAGGGEISRFHFSKSENITEDIIGMVLSGWSDPNYNNFYQFYDSNYNFVNEGNYIFEGFYDNEGTENYDKMLKIKSGGTIPKIKDLIQYNSWSEYEQEHLEGDTEVNLDNYEYVLLSLKDYNQTKAFQTNLQVKGQIGITPIYNYGQTSKDSITGVQVQDRCNVSYENYTSYPFYILQSDLQNNAIYAIKECSSGSSFKFDNTIFNITYITAENKDNPTITIDGKTYNVIPYGDLPSTATKNEENNYIPGESGSATDTGGLDSAIKNVQQKMSEIWNTFTYFTDFINQIFSVFPDEVKTILLSAFTIMIIIGLIKIFIN